MNPAFIINPAISMDEVKDAIYQKMVQARGVTNCLLLADREINHGLYGTVWIIDTLLEEIDLLLQQLERTKLIVDKIA